MKAVTIAAFAALSILSSPRVSSAQPEEQATQESKDAARTLAEKGYELFEAGKYAEAMEHFKQAEQKFHASPHLLFIARSLVALGKLVEGRDAYEKVVGEQLANYAPDAFRTAQADARKELEALRKRIPSIQVAVIGADADRAKVTLDGIELKSWRTQTAPANPGGHTVVATVDGREPVSRSVTLTEGVGASVSLSFDAPPAPIPVTPEPDVTPSAAPAGGSLVPVIAAFSVGALGLGIGAITGAMSLSKVSDVKGQCPDEPRCPKSLEGDADTAKTLGTVSTIGFVVGGLGVGAGVVLLVMRPHEPPPAPTAWSIRPRIGLGSAYLDGRF